MDKILMLALGTFLFFNGINVIFTGEMTTLMGAGAAGSHDYITYQDNKSRFIVEVTFRLIFGVGLLVAVLTGKNLK
ncbi:MAG: hypothetical protein OQK22_11575 [Colwellia sp.]|nr:hypothetical protein [Colwellia sp.]